nr:hypothetical protein [Tanacetum cinerariifolium]
MRAATTASSLEAKLDSCNITKTQSKATLNELSSQRTDLGGGTRCQENMGILLLKLDVLGGEEVFVVGKNENFVKEVVVAAQVSTAATTVIITTEEITLAQALDELKTSRPKVKGIVFQDLDKSTTTTKFLHNNHKTKLQAEFDEEERPTREKAKKEERANIDLIEEWDDIQAKIDVDHQLAERLQAQEQEELSDAEKATLFQQLLENRRKHFVDKRAEEKRNKPPTQDHQRMIMCTYLKNMKDTSLKI